MTWQTASFGILAVVLGGGFLWYERRRPPARVLALVAALAALAVVGRLAFAALPNVKPTTDIVLFAGYALGGVPGFMVGALTALVSNVFLSQGPWTPWQMVGWGAVGVGGALLAWMTRGRELSRVQLAIACGLAGAAFGAFMDVYQWTLAARQDLDSYLAISASSAPYNAAHVIGNVVFCLLIGPAFIRALRRYRRRLEVRWDPRPAYGAAAALVVALAVVTGGSIGAAPASASPEASAAASPAVRASAYLAKAQNADGGFGPAAKAASTQIHTGWASLGLTATGHNPQDVKRKRGRSALAYLKRNVRGLSDVGEIERTILVVEAANLSARSFGGRDLVADLLKQRRADGSIANYVSYTAFGILALRAAGEQAGSTTLSWLLASQNADGGFSVARGGTSDADMTGVVLQALAAVGRAASPAAKRAVDFLHGIQAADGGFGQMSGSASNSQSTAYAIQGLVAAGADDAAVDRAEQYVAGLQRGDGSIAYSSTSTQTPVWVTAQALLALRKAPFPLDAVKPKPKPKSSKPSQAASENPSDADAGGGASTPSNPGPTAGGIVPSTDPVPSGTGDDAAQAPAASGDQPTPAPTTTPLPQSVPTPDADPADAASAQRAAAGAGDDGVPPGLAIGIGAAVLVALLLLWRSRRRIAALMRRGGTLLPGKLRRSH
jgi:energy-coupling factor transport system substrate-specific component